jgi:hypothetical protein
MHPITIGREIAAVWALMASYPLRNTGHLGVLHHDEAIRKTLTGLAANQRSVQ